MPFRNIAVTMCIQAWDTSANAAKTGDAANITVRGVGDGTEFTPSSPSITEMDSTNLPGVYKVSLTANENNYACVLLGGKSSTSGVVIQPVQWMNEISSNLVDILGTALSEGATGRLANAFKTLLDVASPVLTTASVNQTGDNYARIGSTGSGLTSLAPASTALSTAQWTNTRAGNLDNLDVAVSSRLATSGYTTPPTAVQNRQEMDSNSTKLANLDATVSSRAPSSTALSTTQWTNARAALLDFLDAAVSSRLATSGYTAPANATIAIIATAVATYLDVAVSSRAAAGDAMTLTSAERTNLTNAMLDLAATVDGRTLREIYRLLAAAEGGKTSGMGTMSGVIRDLADTKDRVQATIDADGNRTAVTLNLT
jgi:ABC-type phosphate/phosphonate transport system substrate-binding protein